MKTKHLYWLIPLLIVLIFVGSVVSFYNGTIKKQENVRTSLANIESSYQRRADLIPQLISTVQGAANFERGVLLDVVEARAKATSTTINLDELSPNAINQFAEAQGALSGALSRLLVTVEAYPDIKSNQNFLEFQSQLEGTENRINVERNRYNQAINVYNSQIRVFPGAFYNKFFGFTTQFERFKAITENAEQAPDVNFDFD